MTSTRVKTCGICFLFGILFILTAEHGVNAKKSCRRTVKNLKLSSHTKVAKKNRNYRTVKLTCDAGYFFSKGKTSTTISCKNGVIKHPLPACRGCNQPPKIKNGTRTFSRTKVGSTATYSCNVGYTLIGGRKKRCRKNLRWSGRKRKPFCRRNQCYRPRSLTIRNGNVTLSDPTYGEFATLSFECNEGYELKGDEDIVCRENRWSNSRFPYCRKKRCPDPGTPENGRRVGNIFYIGSVVRFRCNSGFKLRGSQKITCQKDKTWSGNLTTCDDGRSHCRNPGIPFGARKRGKLYNQGSAVYYACKSGMKLIGSKSRRCLKNRTWTGVPPKCVDKNYRMFPSINETLENFQEGFVDPLLQKTCSGKNVSCPKADSRGRRLHMKYKDGLDLIFVVDASSSIKKENFEIAKGFLKTIVKIFGVDRSADGTRIACVTFGSRANVEFTFNDASVNTKIKALARIDRISYTIIDGQRTSQRGGGTNTRAALDEVRNVIMPVRRPKAKTALFLVTDGNSNIGGEPKKAAKYLRGRGVEIYVVGIGNRVNQQSLRDLASGEGDKEHIFSVKNFKELKKIERWIAIKKQMDYSECGIPYQGTGDGRGRIVGGRKTKGKIWPWAVRLYVNGKHECGGTIVNEQFILTAAHCVHLSTRQDVTVRFGNGDKTPSKFIHEHPNYDDKKFTNDIAMIRIKKLKRFTRKKQAICLPNGVDIKKVTGPGRKMSAVGWGGTKRLKIKGEIKRKHMSKDLKEVQLPFIADKLCEKNVKNLKRHFENAYFTNATQFCAGDKTGKNDTCKGDSGGPGMVLTRDTQNRPKWYQVGIVSWGAGCAQKGQFGYYTKVSSFLHWINKIIRNHSV